ncbi:MAG: hypothetical protein P8Z50_05810, partial [candidate division WOR-3 bacterium]
IGGEYSIGVLKLRAGYKFNYDEEGLCAGIGIGMSNIKLDYAYSAFGAFNLVNRVTLGVLF